MESKARRRRVPAFGEWNYYYYSGELATPTAAAASSEWYAPAAAELEASSDVWFKYSPPPRRPPRSAGKARRPAKAVDRSSYDGGKRGLRRAATATRASSDAVAPSSVERVPVGKAAATGRARVVRPVDADLYQVPPPEFAAPDYDDEPRRWHKDEEKKKKKKKRASRRQWMSCFGFNCVPAE